MKRILIIAYDCNPQKGAEAMMAYNWVTSLAKNYIVKVITDIRHKDCLDAKGVSFEVEYVTYTSEKTYSLLAKVHAYNILYKLFIKSYKKKLSLSEIDTYDLIHCLTPAGYFTYNDLYKLNKPLVVGPLGGGIKLPKGFCRYKTFQYLLRNIYYSCIRHNPKWKKYYNNCSKILIGTRYLLEHLPKSVHSKTVEFFDTVVDINKYSPCYQRKNETINILFSGRMELSKGCLLLLEAFKLLMQEAEVPLRLIMLGEGSQLPRIKKIIKKANLDQYIKLPGFVSSEDVKEYLQNSDIYCLPTLREPGGTSILEALACGIPVITTDYGGPSISVTEECGIKIDAQNYNKYVLKLKQAIKYLIDNPEERRRLGQNGRMRAVAEYSHEKLEEKISNFYKSMFEEIVLQKVSVFAGKATGRRFEQ